MKPTILITALLIVLQAQAVGQIDDTCITSRCSNLTGFADSTIVGGCEEFTYRTEAYDLQLREITVTYQRRKDSIFVRWPGHTFYQGPADSLHLWESMKAYNFALFQIIEEEK